MRPADANETAWAWHAILSRRSGPAGLALSRQDLPVLTTGEQTARGAYILAEAEGDLRAIIMASGSEVRLALEARTALQAEGIGVRVVSAPCLEWFEEQSEKGPCNYPLRVIRPFALTSWPFGRQHVCICGVGSFAARV